MVYQAISGILNLETAKDPDQLVLGQLSKAFNMEYIGDSDLYVRRGSNLYRDKSIFGGAIPIDITTFKKRDENFYREIYFLNNGKVFYVNSNAADFTSQTPSLTEIKSPTDTSPAFGGTVSKVSFDKINNILSVVFGTQDIYYFDATVDRFKLTPDPSAFRVTLTIGNTVNASLDAVYNDAGGLFQLKVMDNKVSGDGVLTLSTRQISGTARPSATGTLTKVSGTGDSSIPYTAVSYSDTFEEISIYKRRAVVVSNEGNVYLSNSRNPIIFNGATSGNLEFDVIEGFKVTNFVTFKRGAVITTGDEVVQRFSLTTLTGYRFSDDAFAEGQFKAERESEIHGMIGRSAVEIGNVVIGLTRNGFIGYTGEVSDEFGLTVQNTISKPIRDQIENINFAASDQIFALADTVNQRYLCAVPLYQSTVANAVFVYEYGKSIDPNYPKWNFWTFGYGNIKSLSFLVNQLYVSDEEGNVHKQGVDGVFLDSGNSYSSRIETGSIGAGTELVDKVFNAIMIKLKVPPIKQELRQYVKLDRTLISKVGDRPIPLREIEPKVTGENLVSEDTFVDFFTLVGNGKSDVFNLRVDHSGGQGKTAIIGLSSSNGVNWGVLNIILELTKSGSGKGV